MDRISQLPQPILHHILCFLSQKEAAQTCVLSKSWRYLWSTRPKFEFNVNTFRGSKQTFISLLNTSLQRYYDRNLSLHEFVAEFFEIDSELVSLLEKWIPIVLLNIRVHKFHLCFYPMGNVYFDVPPVVFKSENLKELYLGRCQVSPLQENVSLKHLQILNLTYVRVSDEALEKIVSKCTLIENVTLHACEGLRGVTVRRNEAGCNLKRFSFEHCMNMFDEMNDGGRIEIDAPSIETISVIGCSSWFHHNKYFPNLTCLHLSKVRISSKSLHILSRNFPNLRELNVIGCYGFEEFHLLCHSIESVYVRIKESIVKATFDVPNIVTFRYEGEQLPQSTSFTKNYRNEWKSYVKIGLSVNFDEDSLSWFFRLYEMLEALSQSEICLKLYQYRWTNGHAPHPHNVCNLHVKPIVVERLELSLMGNSLTRWSDFINDVLRICRPREISDQERYSSMREREYELSQFQYNVLVMEREGKRYFWQHDLEEVIMETFDEDAKEWNIVYWKVFSECELQGIKYTEMIRLRLKWRDCRLLL